MEKKQNPMKEILGYAGERRNDIRASQILSVVSVLFGMIPFICTALLLNRVVQGTLVIQDALIPAVTGWLGYLLKTLLFTKATLVSHKAAYEILKNIRLKIMGKLARISMGTVQSKSSGEFKQLIIDDVERLEYPLAHAIPEQAGNILLPLLVVLFLIIIDFWIALAALASAIIGTLVYSGMMIGRAEMMQQYMQANAGMNETIVEYVNGMEVIKVFNQSASSLERFRSSVQKVKDMTLKWYRHCWPFMSIGQAIMPSCIAFVLPAGILLLGSSSITENELIIGIVLSLGIVGSLQNMMLFRENVAVFYELQPQISALLAMEELPQREKSEPAAGCPENQIELKNIHFGYTEQEIIHDISLDIPGGSVTALIGPSGSGKSTLAKLLDRFWDVSAGTILIGGRDIREYTLTELAEKISYVAQDNYLFHMSLRDNIRIGRPEATDAEVEEAARMAGCAEFIKRFPQQYDTSAGDAGSRLSGGERQRIAIARAMLKNAPIVILDEATAFTDPENEDKLQAAIDELTRGKTLIVIAHRLSTIMFSDQIVLMEKGRIAAKGTHEELLENSGSYRRMWEIHTNASEWAMNNREENVHA